VFSKLNIGTTDVCTCGTGKMTAHHRLQECHSYKLHWRKIRQSQVPFQDQLCGDVNSSRKTNAFFKNINVDVSMVFEEKKIISAEYYGLCFKTRLLIIVYCV
jgi:hypothetical protein